MKPKFIVKALRVMAIGLAIVICLGFVSTAQLFDSHDGSMSLIAYTMVFSMFIFTPLSLILVCLGVAHLLEGNGDKQ